MIDISQLTALISAFRVETEKESISPETVGKILQDITDLLATAIGETEYNIIRVWKETLQQYRFLYDIQQRSVEDHCTKLFFKPVQSVFVSTPLQAFTSFAIPYRGYFYFNSRKLYPKGVVFLDLYINYTRKGVIYLNY
jgi:hypothetical protein